MKRNNLCLGGAVDSDSSSPGQGKSHIRYALNNIQFISDKSSAELVLYLCGINKVHSTINFMNSTRKDF